jgi:NAD(P)H-hydrate repair Nnr-like enzyme with NAD(P)H-hydrate dehydratase domain
MTLCNKYCVGQLLYVFVTVSVPMTYKGKKGKVHLITGHKDLQGEQRYSSTLSLTSALGGWVVKAKPCPL